MWKSFGVEGHKNKRKTGRELGGNMQINSKKEGRLNFRRKMEGREGEKNVMLHFNNVILEELGKKSKARVGFEV